MASNQRRASDYRRASQYSQYSSTFEASSTYEAPAIRMKNLVLKEEDEDNLVEEDKVDMLY